MFYLFLPGRLIYRDSVYRNADIVFCRRCCWNEQVISEQTSHDSAIPYYHTGTLHIVTGQCIECIVEFEIEQYWCSDSVDRRTTLHFSYFSTAARYVVTAECVPKLWAFFFFAGLGPRTRMRWVAGLGLV